MRLNNVYSYQMRVNKNHITFWLFLSFICLSKLNAQEYTLPLFTNINYYYFQSPVPLYQKNNSLSNKTYSQSISLPFFDDFHYADRQVYPDINKWQDSSVYINFGYAKYPISIGVATFDGLNKFGLPYSSTASNTDSDPADTLTSQPINLETDGIVTYTPADSISLVFYYQRMGNGDNPESSDSLILDFFKPKQNIWQNVIWTVTGSNIAPVNDSTFNKVQIFITDTAYFHDGFQFRFRNKATPVGAVDHWHLDYIKLDKNTYTTDTILDDAAFYYMSTPLLKNYSKMPYKHFVPTEMATKIRNYIKNNNKYTTKNINYQFNIYDALWNNLYHYNGGSANTAPGPDTVTVHKNPSFNYTITPLDSTRFYVKHYINTLPDVCRDNDTIIQCTPLTNYFAYDDGQAELGYYLKFYGTQVAQRYTLNVTDTLRAMDIFFIPVNSSNIVGKNIFRMCVWNNMGGQPGSLVYRDSLMAPAFTGWGYNVPPRYYLTKPLILSPGTYFFGIQCFPPSSQYTITIGLDVNYDKSQNTYYNSIGVWSPSSVKGSLMMHPVFGDSLRAVNVMTYPELLSENIFNIYPNPTDGYGILNIYTSLKNSYDIRIMDVSGKEVLRYENLRNMNKLNVSALSAGVYLVQFFSDNVILENKKLIVK